MNCGRWRGVSRVSRWVKFPRFSLNILFSLPAAFIPFPKPTYRRLFSPTLAPTLSFDNRSYVDIRHAIPPSVENSIAVINLSDPFGSYVLFSIEGYELSLDLSSLARCFDLTRKNRIINPSWSCRLFGHVKLIDPFYDPLFLFYLLSYLFFYLNSTDGWLLILAVIRQSKRVLIWVVYSNWKRWIRRFFSSDHLLNAEKCLHLIKIYLN